VIILSADATPARMQHLLDSGAHAYITKPLDVRTFLQTVARSLPARRPVGH
jgi:CheY-like chemotaxis protein